MAELRYPAEWESDVVLADGGTVHLRPLRPNDSEALLTFFTLLSDRSRMLRFFAPVSPQTARRAARLDEVDYDGTFGIVAELGDDLIAVGSYQRTDDPTCAEVAFAVADEHQARGIGSMLLEHLAAAGRIAGIRRFVASTLPENRKMLRVFNEAGFAVEREHTSGIVELSFLIADDEAVRAVQDRREHVAEARSVARLLAPRSIAVIGAGRRPRTIGHEVFRNLVEGGFAGPVYPVNPSAQFVASVRAYPTVLEIPEPVDLAVVCVPAPAVEEVIEQCAAKGVHGVVVISAGFAEVGDTQADTERRLVESARRHGMRLVGPNCMGVVNTAPDVSMNATFAPFSPVRGRVGFSSQSGALGIELLSEASALGLGVSTFVSLGNKADVSGNDLLQFWESDPDTDVILLYLESFGNPRKFARIARRVARVKPIIAVKSGRSAPGARGAASHTAALASPDRAVDALFRQAGVIRVDTLEQLFETATVVAHQPLPRGNRVAIVSNGGGPAILAADACDAVGLEVPELSAATQDTLRSFADPGAGLRNPVDLVASATAATYERALRTILGDDEIDAVIAIFVPPLVTDPEDVAAAIEAAAADADGKPIVSCFLGRRRVDHGVDRGVGAIPSFPFPESAAAALGRAAEHAAWRRRPEGAVPDLAGTDTARARALAAAFCAEHPDGGWLGWDAAAALCSSYGISLVPAAQAGRAYEAAAAAEHLGFPVALKAAAPELVHKTDVGGVVLGLGSKRAVHDSYVAMHLALGESFGGATVQSMAPPGVETLVGVTHDALFGPLVMFGMGGTAAELLRDTALRIVPLTDLDAHELVRSLRSSPLLFGYRGSPRVDTGALEELLLRVAQLADDVPEVAELDFNPVIVSEDGLAIVDVKVRLAPVAPGPPSGIRRMRDR